MVTSTVPFVCGDVELLNLRPTNTLNQAGMTLSLVEMSMLSQYRCHVPSVAKEPVVTLGTSLFVARVSYTTVPFSEYQRLGRSDAVDPSKLEGIRIQAHI